MKSEVMAAAITGIDEKLIADASNIGKKKRSLRPIYGICALAACLVLVFTFMFTGKEKTVSPQLFINGTEISQTQIMASSPKTHLARETSNEICVELTLSTERDTALKVSHGKMDICSTDDTGTLYYTGNEYTTRESVSICWHIDEPDIKKSYNLTIDEETVYNLSYDETSGNWLICKQ